MKQLVFKLYVAAAIAYLGVELGELLVERIADRVSQRLDWRFRNVVDHFAGVHGHLDLIERGKGDEPEPERAKK